MLCPLFNFVGAADGTTAACDIDHLLKRFRARTKSALGFAMGVFTFTKTDLAILMNLTGIILTADEAHCLFDPEDLMDVVETIKCIYAIGRLADVPYSRYQGHWRKIMEHKLKFPELYPAHVR